MKRKILIAIYIVLILLTSKFLYNILINNSLINKYKNGEYSEEQAKILTYINFPQSYISNYNYGNVLYQNGKYEEAIEKYAKSLQNKVPKNKECNIRINYALAICRTVQIYENDQESIKNAIEKYEAAIDILVEKGCANKENNNGHSQNAEQLKKDIQKEIEKLKKLQKEDDEKDEEEKKDTEKNKKAETIEEKIQNIRQEAIKEQREVEQKYSTYGKDINTPDKNW